MDEALLMDGLRRERLHLHEIPLCDFICRYGSICCEASHFKTIPLLENGCLSTYSTYLFGNTFLRIYT